MKKLIVLLAFLAASAYGQISTPAVQYPASLPGTCANPPYVWVSGGTLYYCSGGLPTAAGSGSGTVSSGTAWSPAFYAATGTAVSGTTPFTGLEYWAGSAAPGAATAAQVVAAIGTTPVAEATNLASYPSLCSGSQFSQGLSSGSNNCATPAGGSGGTPLTTAQLLSQLATVGVSMTANAHNALYLMQGLSGTSGTLADVSGNANNGSWTFMTFPTPQGAYIPQGNANFVLPVNVCNNAGTVMLWLKRQGNYAVVNYASMSIAGGDSGTEFLGFSEATNGSLLAGIGAPALGSSISTVTTDRLSGNASAAFVLGSPVSIYPNGRPPSGYIIQGNLTSLTATTNCWLGQSANNGSSFIGTIYAALYTSSTLTAAQVAAADLTVKQFLGSKGIYFDGEVPASTSAVVSVGDSILYGLGVDGALKQTIPYYASQQLRGNAYQWYNLGLTSDSALNIDTGTLRVSGWRNILARHDGQNNILFDQSGHNDIATAPSTVLGYKEGICQQADSAAGTTPYLSLSSACLAATIYAGSDITGTHETNRQTLNSDIISAILAQTYGSAGQTVGLVNTGQDPLLGLLQNVADTSCWADGVHLTAICNKYYAQYLACGVALLTQNQSCTIGIRVPRGDLIGTSATTGSVALYQLLPNQIVSNAAIQPLSAHAGTGLSGMTISVGDTLGSATQYSSAYSVFTQPSQTSIQGPGTVIPGNPAANSVPATAGGVVTAYYAATGANLNAVYTDLAVNSATNTVVSSASHTFVALDLNTKIYISAGTGFATGLYNLNGICTGSGTGSGTGITACTAAGQAVLDHSPAAVSTTGGSYDLGDVIVYLTVKSI